MQRLDWTGLALAAVVSVWSFGPVTVHAEEALCAPQTFEDTRYTVCTIDLARDDLRIAWRDAAGAPYRSFQRLEKALSDAGATLRFAMNGGMYDTDFAPIGLYIEDGVERAPPNTNSSTKRPEPNFYKKPNGIFWFGKGNAGVLETSRYLDTRPDAAFATQSGPLLVIDGALHPMFIEGSRDRQRRNGVGVDGSGHVQFVISEDPVNFHDFARFFRDGLGCRDALYLDGGSAPALHAPELGRSDWPGHGGFGPIIAVVGKAADAVPSE